VRAARSSKVRLKIVSSRFERSATRAEDEPVAAGPDVVFLGRSNVGKSTLINRLLGVRGLARTSSQPGKTQCVNFYRINETCFFVDLPGYGYAKVPLKVRATWKPMIEGFLARRRERIVLGFLIVDARHEPTKLDLAMHEWLDAEEIPYVVAASKSDKLSGNARSRVARTLRSIAGTGSLGDGPILVSGETGLGIKQLWRHLDPAIANFKNRN